MKAMQTLKYPIGIQTFSTIIEEGYAYVDKTAFVARLVSTGKYYFLSRPRRFGKSLLLSTLEAYFEGRRDLFKGLAIEEMNMDWTPTPVLHFDFNAQDYLNPDGLRNLLNVMLKEYELIYGCSSETDDPPLRFRNLISHIHAATGRKVAILVDEYDKALLGIEEHPELFERNQRMLKGFFGNLKTMDRHIRFAMLTGVARFSKVSIFSDLNNLEDISLGEEYADICGWTDKELVDTFRMGLEELASREKVSYAEALEKMRHFYDGYLFARGGHRLYNPYSALLALKNKRLSYFWFETGTPTYLVRRIRRSGIVLPALNGSVAFESELLEVGLNDASPIPLLFQTGYLTIKSVEGDMYILEFPNKEVEIGFARHLQPLYVPQMDLNGPFSIVEFGKELREGEPKKFMERIAAMVKSIPYEQHDERLYQNLVYLLFTLLGADSRLEEHTNVGRPDIVVRTDRYVYVFEFKYNGSATAAMEQIHERDYAGRHAVDGREIFLIAANFTDRPPRRGLADYLIEKV